MTLEGITFTLAATPERQELDVVYDFRIPGYKVIQRTPVLPAISFSEEERIAYFNDSVFSAFQTKFQNVTNFHANFQRLLMCNMYSWKKHVYTCGLF